MMVPLMLLAIGSLFVGYLFKDMMIGLGTNFWGNSLFTLPEKNLFIESEYIPQHRKFIPVVFTFTGILLAFVFNYQYSNWSYNLKTSAFGKEFYSFFNKR